MELVPAIIAQNGSEVSDKLNLVESQTDWAHLDIADGQFAPTMTWQTPSDLELVEGRIKLEAHLMINEPEATLAAWTEVVDRVIVHAEATADLAELIEVFDHQRTQLGVALLLSTPVETIASFLPQLKFINLLAVAKIGYHGEPFDERVLAKIKTLRSLAPKITISVDGGLNLANAQSVIAAGADRLVVGNALWQAADLTKTIAQFQNLA